MEVKIKLNLAENNKIEAIDLDDIKYHLLPQYGPISCFGMSIDVEKNKKTAWIFTKGSDSLAEWVLGDHDAKSFCKCFSARRIFRLEPDPVYLTQLNQDYLLVGSKMNFIKKMKLN